MIPPIFPTVAASTAVQALIGTGVGNDLVRFYEFGRAPQRAKKPYAVWQNINGLPENYLDSLPDTDSFTAQIDVYADTAAAAEQVAIAIRDAIEPVAYVTRWGGQSRDPDTQNYRETFDTEWIVYR